MTRRFTLALLLCSLPTLARSQATPAVPPGSRVYVDIDRLAAARLIDTLLVGVRPFSEREVVRLLNEARRNIGRNAGAASWAQAVIDADLARYTRVENRAIDAALLEAAVLDSPDRGVPDTPTGNVDARIQPLAANRGGRELVHGATESIETFHSATLGPYVALSLNPRTVVREPRGAASAGTDLRLQSGALTLRLGNVLVDAGRSYALFGQAPTGGLLLSENAPALTMVRATTDAPFVLPWWFRLLGPMRGTLLAADMGVAHVVHPHAKLAAYHLTALPHRNFEFGVELEDAMGGAGGEPASFGDRVEDLLLIPDLVSSKRNFLFSNKIAGADFHWRMPSWSGFELYTEVAVDDFDGRRLKSDLLQDGGYVVGTALSCLVTCGKFGVRAEYHQTGIRYYTHSSYPLAVDETILGDPLGPRALGGYLTLDGEVATGAHAGITAAFEVRSGNSYTAVSSTPHEADFHFEQTARAPGEKRSRIVATWTSDMPAWRLGLHARFGGEHVNNFGFVAGRDRMNWLASLALELR